MAPSPDSDLKTPGRSLEIASGVADETRVFLYTLRLRYPNGRTFTHVTESERLLDVGAELEAFGRIWRIADKIRPVRLEDAAKPGPEAFTCHPVSDP